MPDDDTLFVPAYTDMAEARLAFMLRDDPAVAAVFAQTVERMVRLYRTVRGAGMEETAACAALSQVLFEALMNASRWIEEEEGNG